MGYYDQKINHRLQANQWQQEEEMQLAISMSVVSQGGPGERPVSGTSPPMNVSG